VNDDGYGRSADMRLHDLRRDELGMRPRPPVLTSYVDPEYAMESADDEDEAFAASGPILVAALDAQPRVGLIPGALITIVLTVVNDGTLAAYNVAANLALPVGTTYRAGTLTLDGTRGNDVIASALFENGSNLGTIEPGARRTLIVKLLVEAGVGDIVLSPHLTAAAGAVLGLRAMRLKRTEPSTRGVAAGRAFYELDEVEITSEEFVAEAKAPAGAPSPATITVLQPPEYPPLVIAVAPNELAFVVEQPSTAGTQAIPSVRLAEDENLSAKFAVDKPATAVAEAHAEPAARPVAPPRIESVRSSDEPLSVMGKDGPILIVRLDHKRLAALNRLFSGPSLGTIAHYLLLNALAVTDPLPGDGVDGSIAAFVAQQEQLLSRALITTRLGKSPAPDRISAPLPPFPPRISTHLDLRLVDAVTPGEIMLVRALSTSDLIDLQRTVWGDDAAPFQRATLLFVGLCANDLVVEDERERRNAGKALTEYAALATDEIGRIFQRATLGRAPVPFRPTDSSFDDAARTVLEALGAALP
jgi:hypothetical protein